jgi:class 3 adenylate cyclase
VSDPLAHEDRLFGESVTEDMVALIDCLDLERVAVMALAGGGGAGQLFAAVQPQRTSALVLRYPDARIAWAPDYPDGWSEATLEALSSPDVWGTTTSAEFVAPSDRADDRFIRWLARCQRAAASPAVFEWRTRQAFAQDFRQVLPTIKAPTLVLIAPGDTKAARKSRYVADHIPDAHAVTVPGEPLYFCGDSAPTLDAIQEFLTGDLTSAVTDRMLTTMLFTDVVQSTERATELGDRRWRDLLEDHHRLARDLIERHRGRLVDTTGDGALAIFDSPGRAIRAAWAINDAVKPLGIHIRAGLHTGEVEMLGNNIAGIAVHTAARVQALAQADEILVSRTVVDLVAGSALSFESRGTHQLKGVHGTWDLYCVAVEAALT